MLWRFAASLALIRIVQASLVDPSTLPVAIVGTYNVTFAIAYVPNDLAKSLLPASYQNSVLPANATMFPGLQPGQTPLLLELGREANAGPPGLNMLSFQEAKIEVPLVDRTGNGVPFLYKRIIFVDNYVDVIGSWLEYSLNTTFATFNPANSSQAPSFDYTIQGVISSIFSTATHSVPLETFKYLAHLPWFGDGLLCAQHTYNWEDAPSPVKIEGSATLLPPYSGGSGGTTITLYAVQPVVSFQIRGPFPCSAWT
ncbi:hypothetical protein T439DRAFT_325136 [Meredithblackwellia eburnea MCA 4105]